MSALLRNPVEAEAWRLVHSRYAPDTPNRLYALMHKIVMSVKSWCECFKSGCRAWELDIGEWERAPGTSLAGEHTMMKMAPIFLNNNLHLGSNAESKAPKRLVTMGVSSTTSAVKKISC